MKKLYVGNLAWGTTEEDLRTFFSEVGDVHSCAVIKDRDTGQSRGFGFVEMDGAAADKAISQLNGRELGSRPLKINEARDKPRRTGGGGGGGGRC